MKAKVQKRVRLKDFYHTSVLPSLKKKLNCTSVMQVPKIEAIYLNMGEPEKKALEFAVADMTKIAGQKPVVCKARKSIAGFKIREGWPIGCKVTLRRNRMYEFLDRLIAIYLPRVRDFRGLSVKSFDGRGNFSLGVKEQIICPEIDYDKIDTIRGFDIIIKTSARTDKEAYLLLKEFNFPFRDQIN